MIFLFLKIAHAVAAAAVGAPGAAAFVAWFCAASAAGNAGFPLAVQDVGKRPAAPDAGRAAGLSRPVAAVPALDAFHISSAVAGCAVFPFRAARFWRRVLPALSRAGCADEQFLSAAFCADTALCPTVPKPDSSCSRSVAASAHGLSLSAAQYARIAPRRGKEGKAQDERGDAGGNRSFHGHLLRTDVSVSPDSSGFRAPKRGACPNRFPFGNLVRIEESLASSQDFEYRQCG